MSEAESTVVILPTFNEAENLVDLVERVRRSVPGAHVLVVDDASPDGTGAIADRLAAHDSQVRVLHRTEKRGLGCAYIAAFEWALAEGFEIIVASDADGSHRPEELTRLLDAVSFSDVAIGSRWIAGGRVVDWPLSRMILSRAGSLYARTMLRLPQRDVTGGFRAYRASALQTLDMASVSSQGYCFQIEMLWRAHRAGLAIAEVPITFVERRHGVSKMHASIIIEAMSRVTLWGLRSVLAPRRRARALTSLLPVR